MAIQVKKGITVEPDSPHGYWMYSDGSSYWGISLYRRAEELPIETNKEMHSNENLAEKLEWYKTNKPSKTPKEKKK